MTFELILTFLGGGALATILAFVLDIRKQNRTDSSTLINDIYKEIGRLTQELAQVKEEKQTKDKENLELKEENMKLRLEMDELKKDYQEIKEINEELRRKIDTLLNQSS